MPPRKTVQVPPDATLQTDEMREAIARKVQLASAPAWRPNVGDSLVNPTVLGIRRGESQYGTYPILVLDSQESGIVALHAFHTLLRNRLSEIRPTVGDVIESVTYLGEKVTNASEGKEEKDVTTYHHYIVTMAGDAQEDYSWE